MKPLLLLMLLALAGAPCAAQLPVTADQVDYAKAPVAATMQVTDSLQQAVHTLFRRGRHLGLAGALSGSLLAAGGATYAVRDRAKAYASTSLSIGLTAMAVGLWEMVVFSRRREKKVLVALARGEALPGYVVRSLPVAMRAKRTQ